MNSLLPGLVAAEDFQSSFRHILRALSRPGEIVTVTADLAPPPPLSVASAAILLTLADTAIRVGLPSSAKAAKDWLVFHTGASIASDGEADFIVAHARPSLSGLQIGSDDKPECGATLILDLPRFGSGRRYRLTGPGVESETFLHAPLDADFAAEWRQNGTLAPRGVDILLCAGLRIAGLPRSVALEEL